jgi:site-specific DNA recombinase
MKAVVYARFSSDNQKEESITAQVRACRVYAEKNGLKIIKVYSDEAESALTDDRPQFLQMIKDLKNGLEVDYVLYHKTDRFARNRYDAAIYKRKIQECGARHIAVDQPLDPENRPEDIIMESLMDGLAEYYSRNLAKEVMKGMKELAYEAKHVCGRPPLGLAVGPDRRYVIDEKNAPAIRTIFKMYDQGYSYSKILEKVNGAGYRTQNGNPFGKNSLHDILKNKKYAGVYTFNRAAKKTLAGKRNHHASKNAKEIIEIPEAIPAIIDLETFERVQRKMKTRERDKSQGRNKAKVVYLLSGIIWCGECNNRMVGAFSSYRPKPGEEPRRKYRYECNYRKRTRQCGMSPVGKTWVEDAVISKLEKEILNKKSIHTLAHKIYDYYKKQRTYETGEGDYLKKEIREVEKKISNLVDVIVETGKKASSLVEKISLLEQQKATLEERLREWQVRHEEEIITFERIVAYLNRYREILLRGDPMEQKQVIQELVEKVVVYDDDIKITFKVSVDSNGGRELFRIESTALRSLINKPVRA